MFSEGKCLPELSQILFEVVKMLAEGGTCLSIDDVMMWFCWLYQTMTSSTYWGSSAGKCEAVVMRVSFKSEYMVVHWPLSIWMCQKCPGGIVDFIWLKDALEFPGEAGRQVMSGLCCLMCCHCHLTVIRCQKMDGWILLISNALKEELWNGIKYHIPDCTVVFFLLFISCHRTLLFNFKSSCKKGTCNKKWYAYIFFHLLVNLFLLP